MSAEIIGMEDVIARLKELEEMPNTVIRKAALKGANQAMTYVQSNLQPVNQQGEDFLPREGRKNSHASGTLKAALRIKQEHNAKGKSVYQIQTTWWAHFIDLHFTSHRGNVWQGTHFLKYSQSKHYEEIRQTMIDEVNAGIDKIVGNKGG